VDCKIYCYQNGDTCDLVFEVKDIGVACVAHYDVDNEFMWEHWESLKEYESTMNVEFNKTYIGSID